MKSLIKIMDFDNDAFQLEQFLALPRTLHSADPNWLPDPGEARWLTAVAKRKFLAMAGDQVCGRAAVMVNPNLRDERDHPYGQIGFFECVQDLSAAASLINVALAWLRSNTQDTETILAPMNFDTWHAYRLRTRGFDEPTFLMEPHNPSYYPAQFSALGFTPISHYLTKTVDDLSSLPDGWQPFYRDAIGRGYTFRSFDPCCVREEMSLIHRLSLDIFRENLFFVDISEDEFRSLYAGVAGELDPDLLIFILAPNREPIGFSFSIPDHRQPGTANLKTMGVLPHENGKGVGAALAYEAYHRLEVKGFERVNHCLMRAGNRADQFDRDQAKITREYTLYARPLQP